MWRKIKDIFSYGEEIKRRERRLSQNDDDVIKITNSQDVVKSHAQVANKHKSKSDTSITRSSNVETNMMTNRVRGEAKKNYQTLRTAEQIKNMAIEHNYKGPLCQYCGSQSTIKTAKEHRGKDKEYCYWVCPTCPNTSVTTIKGSYEPSGDLADAETRLFRMEVQKLIHTKRKSVTRAELQNWIHDTTLVPLERAYIGRLSKDDLARVAVRSQKEEFDKRYSYIFNKV